MHTIPDFAVPTHPLPAWAPPTAFSPDGESINAYSNPYPGHRRDWRKDGDLCAWLRADEVRPGDIVLRDECDVFEWAPRIDGVVIDHVSTTHSNPENACVTGRTWSRSLPAYRRLLVICTSSPDEKAGA